MLIRITDKEKLIALVLRKDFSRPGINFLTEDRSSLQVGTISHPANYVIPAHDHQINARMIEDTQEVLVLRRGRVRVDFFTEARVYIESVVMDAGDILLLISGGHGFKALEEIDMVEIKTGPYMETRDKTRFEADYPPELKIRD
ncbi:MAG: hypothetical protein RL477_813 [Pseudomonadota bacterium]|jgi:hypothetical protein